MLVHQTHLVLWPAILSNNIFCVHFWSKIKCFFVCLPQRRNEFLFLNHRNRKVVGGKHNVLVYYENASASNSEGVVLCSPFKWDILCSFLIENVVIFVPSTTAKWISFRNHRNRKVVGGKHNVLVHYVDASAPNPSGVVLCNPFIWDILWFIYFWSKIVVWSKIHTFHYLNIPSGKLEHRIDSLSSLGHITCEWKASSSQPTIILDVIAVYHDPGKNLQ